MLFCENGTSWRHVWIDKGFTKCFFLPLMAIIPAVIVLIGGTVQIGIYRKYATPRHGFKSTVSYVCQVIFTLILMFQPIVRFGLQEFLTEKTLYGYQLLVAIVQSISWFLVLLLFWQECKKQLPSIPTRSHGLVLLLFWALSLLAELSPLMCWLSPQWWFKDRSLKGNVELAMWILRLCSTFVVFFIGFGAFAVSPSPPLQRSGDSSDDTAVLIGTDHSTQNEGQTGQSSTWRDVFKKLSLLWPFMWPKRSIALQFCVLLCLLLLVAGRVVNLFTPIYYKKIVDSLTPKNTSSTLTISTNTKTGLEFRWDYILIYVFLRFLQGGTTQGFLNNMRSLLWIWVQQYTTREVEVRLFGHLHGLSLRWHLSRKTGEVLRVMDRGTSSINSLLSYIVFNILPTIADIIIAIIYFLTAFNAWFALIVFVTMAGYLIGTIAITEWRTKYRRAMNLLDNERNARGVDSLLNFETVKYYGAEDFEVDKYREAIVNYQKAEWTSLSTLNVLNSVQNLVINGGLLLGSMLCVYYVVDGKGLTVGDYVLFSTYVVQLYGPLNWFGTYYRMIQQAFIDMENMFDLLEEKQEIVDNPGASELLVKNGEIEFRKICFHYQPSKTILRDITFTVPPGQTFALVGPSGGGKSTIIRLLFRFYDPQEGIILIDGQNISSVQQNTLRKAIGVVPQDTVLFNKDIRYNIRYGRVTAGDDEVERAAEAADIHRRILTFPDGYETVVGERGLKLSGGEKQRVAIARTILKAPYIVLLDEATSALDTQTERNIQASLARVCEGRTTLVVAHRLSTIVNADQILVLSEGIIVERGSHDELLHHGGLYSQMWSEQQKKTETEGEESEETEGENGQ